LIAVVHALTIPCSHTPLGKIFSAAKAGGLKNCFVEMDLPLIKASVPYLYQHQV
jgi:hypothetical protein